MKREYSIKTLCYFPEENGGFILVVTMAILIVLTIIGISATNLTEVELQIAGNDRVYKESFYKSDGAEEVSVLMTEENLSCPTGFTRSTLPTKNKNPNVLMSITGIQIVNDRFAYAETMADLPWDPTVVKLASGTAISMDYIPSDGARSIRIPKDIANPNDTDPHGNLALFGKTHLSAGSAVQMAAGYEGKGKGAGNSGAHIAYEEHSQHLGDLNSDTRLRLEWSHLVGQEGDCNY